MIDSVINLYYSNENPAKEILIEHSIAVREKALSIAQSHPELKANQQLLTDGAMVHDIGIIKTYAPDIYCFGEHPYIMHGVLGRQMLEKAGLSHLALFAERHTGTGISLQEIVDSQLPLPHRDMLPITIEEKIICFADLFFSKSKNRTKPKSLDTIRKGVAKHGAEQLKRFNYWCTQFL